ncbi:MAG: NAD(P)H-dependent oxidoreductase subunit E [Candidatus Marinimicrobia bacterium]|nr:NAD(P)H-dependent oxidoreductase subunit E [Candidatus Neomarinimicrobiota bacterium]
MLNPAQIPADPAVLDRILDEKGRHSGAVIAVLQGVQAHYNYLPEPALRYIVEHSEITAAALVGVATFYAQFRHQPAGRHMVSVCVGTACHVKGAPRILDALRRHLKLAEGTDTDHENRFTLRAVNCLGCCTLAPVVQVDDVIYGYATTDNVGGILEDFLRREGDGGRGAWAEQMPPGRVAGDIRVGMGSCCVASGAATIEAALHQRVAAMRAPVRIQRVSCLGLSYEEPLIEVALPDQPPTLYTKVRVEDIPTILHTHFPAPRRRDRLRQAVGRGLEKLYTDAAWTGPRRFAANTRDPGIASYLDPQVHIATASCGQCNPVDLAAYVSAQGFEGLRRVLQALRPEDVLDQIDASGLRGRGGGGYPTGRKWRAGAGAGAGVKYVVCNGDEGDPGAFMDRMLLESYPYRIIEGMLIAGYAVGASQGVLYIRAEYPLAIQRVSAALAACRAAGWLGPDILGRGFAFDLTVMEGAGAFVCGEESALIASIEGRRGMPRMRPPWPAERGLYNRPTLVNNTETFALVPWILRQGPEAFAAIGTARSKGTKVFALAGKVRRGGMIEVPMGMTIRQLIDDIGGGIAGGRALKAVQIGGPSGGCIPARLADTPIDYEALVDVGAMMGSGGLVALDDTDCMVEIARYFLAFTQHESCGKCTFCRIGTKRMLELLERLCHGQGKAADLDELEHLAAMVKRGSLCGLGKTAPNPALTTLHYFRAEYEAHIAGICPAGQCKALIAYEVTADCIGCTRCAQHCPADAIPSTPYEQHVINADQCIRCDACRRVCPSGAIVITSCGRWGTGIAANGPRIRPPARNVPHADLDD